MCGPTFTYWFFAPQKDFSKVKTESRTFRNVFFVAKQALLGLAVGVEVMGSPCDGRVPMARRRAEKVNTEETRLGMLEEKTILVGLAIVEEKERLWKRSFCRKSWQFSPGLRKALGIAEFRLKLKEGFLSNREIGFAFIDDI